MESFWKTRLAQQGWSDRAVEQIPFNWAASTRDLYRQILTKLRHFCEERGYAFPPDNTGTIAEFLCNIADRVKKPHSYIKTATAAMSAMYEGIGGNNLTHSSEIRTLKSALTKAGTKAPRKRSNVMPIKPFRDMFLKWNNNPQLPIKELRLKAITLLALTIMLRPSDIAPKAQIYDPVSKQTTPVTFSTDNIVFERDGSATITVFGNKNDLQRAGFCEKLPPHENPKLDPVAALATYISKTQGFRPRSSSPVFLTLNAPFRAISASTVAGILEDAIRQAGLDAKLYSAKSFRPTGATVAIESGCDPDIVMKMGRWKSRDIFFEHYVHANTPACFSEDILCHD